MRRERLDLVIVVAVAVVANFAYLIFSNGDFYYPDSFTYLAPARNFLRGLGFVADAKAIETLRTPGYPLLLAIFGAHTLPMIVLQHLLNVALAAALYIFVNRRLFDVGRALARRSSDGLKSFPHSVEGSRVAALIAAMLFALDTPTIHYANKILTETVFTILLYILFVLALQKFRFISIGLLTGALVLVRPIAFLYFVALAIFFALRRVPIRQLLAFVIIALALPAVWATRNWYRTGVFTVSSIGGINLLTYRAAGALAIEDGGEFRADVTDEQNGLMEDADDEIQRTLHIEDALELSDAVRSRYYARYAWRVIAEHPWSFAELMLRGTLVNFFDSDWEAMAEVSRFYPAVVQLAIDAWAVAMFIFALIGIAALRSTDRPLALLIGLTVIYFIGVSAGGEAESRFRVPVIPQMAIAAAAGVEAVRRGVRS